MRKWVLIFAAMTIGGLSDADVILVNDTGLPIARIEIDKRHFQDGTGLPPHNKILISIPPGMHHVKLIFRGGADVDWPHFDFKGIHEIWFERDGTNFRARTQ